MTTFALITKARSLRRSHVYLAMGETNCFYLDQTPSKIGALVTFLKRPRRPLEQKSVKPRHGSGPI